VGRRVILAFRLALRASFTRRAVENGLRDRDRAKHERKRDGSLDSALGRVLGGGGKAIRRSESVRCSGTVAEPQRICVCNWPVIGRRPVVTTIQRFLL